MAIITLDRVLKVELNADGSFRCFVRMKFVEGETEWLEECPFVAREDDVEGINPDVLAAIAAGNFDGDIEPYVPTAENEFVPSINARQFYMQLEKEGIISKPEALAAIRRTTLPAAIRAVIDSLPEDTAYELEMSLLGAQTFDRKHPYSSMFVAALGKTPAWGNQFWLNAGTI